MSNQDPVPSLSIFGEANAEAGTSKDMFSTRADSSHGIFGFNLFASILCPLLFLFELIVYLLVFIIFFL